MTATREPRPQRPILGLSTSVCRVLRWVAFVGAIAIVAVLALSSRLELLDARPGGNAFEIRVKPIFMVLFVVGAVLAIRWEIAGGLIAAFSAAGLSAFALGQLERPSALLVLGGFILPGAIWVVLDLHDQRPRVALAGLALVLVAVVVGGSVSYRVYDSLFGPSHPSSDTPALAASAVEWVWSGAITVDSATVVAKVDDDAIAVHLLVSEHEDLADPVLTPDTGPDPEGVVRLPIAGLHPATQYHYAVVVDGAPDTVRAGRFRTTADGPQSFTVAFGGCARVGSNGSVFDTIRAHDPEMFILNGDWNYANLTGSGSEAFREIYDYTLTRPAQAALYRATPIAYVWDDHDFGGNNADSTSATQTAAHTVYRQYVPHYELAGGNTPIFQAFTIGRVRFLITDTRSGRSPASQVDDEEKTMLGDLQRAWFEEELLRADAENALTVWVNPDPWVGEATAGSDTWSGYSTERREIADFIAANQIDRLLMLSGDAHMVAIDDGTNTDYSTDGGAAFPLMHAAALDRPGKLKGGPYSEGAVAGGGQFGLVEIDDRGDSLEVHLTGRNWKDEVLLSYTYTVSSSLP
jgi:hypothetical protein